MPVILTPKSSIPPEKRSAGEVVQSIADNANKVKDAAAELTKRIQRFESYLSAIPGRTPTLCYGSHPDSPEVSDDAFLVLKLERSGKDWTLHFSTGHERYDPSPTEFKPLVDATLKYKIAAIKMFPRLLELIESTQQKLVEEVNAANKFYDDFEATLPKKEGK